MVEIRRVYEENLSVHGAEKIWEQYTLTFDDAVPAVANWFRINPVANVNGGDAAVVSNFISIAADGDWTIHFYVYDFNGSPVDRSLRISIVVEPFN